MKQRQVMPKVSIITRTKNRPLLLERTIKNVMEQSYSDFTMVIVNDGGDARPIEKLLEKHKSLINGRTKLVSNKQSVGHGEACNVGLRNSESEYIVMLDDDDTWHKDFLKLTVNFLEESDFFGVVTASEIVNETYENDKIIFVDRKPFLSFVHEIKLFSMLGGNQFPNMAFLYRREALKKVGMYDKSASPLEDWDFNIRFLKNYDVHFIDKPLVYYHQRAKEKGDLANSIFLPNFHGAANTYLLNKYLRQDLAKDSLGAGFISNISQQMNNVNAENLTFLSSLIRLSTSETHGGINHLHDRFTESESLLRGIDNNVRALLRSRIKKYAKRVINQTRRKR